MFRFTIRDVLLVTAIVALAVGWWLDHRQIAPLQKRCTRLETLARMTVPIMRHFGLDAEFAADNITIGHSYWPPERAPWHNGKLPPLQIPP